MDTKTPIETELLDAIELFIASHGMTASAFGREAVNDSAFVYGLRRGRECRRSTRLRVLAYMRERRAGRAA